MRSYVLRLPNPGWPMRCLLASLLLLPLLSGCLAPGVPLPTEGGAPPAAEVRLDAASLARETFRLVNRERVNAGLAPLAWSDTLARVAEVHSADMARRRYFAHESPEGHSVNDRAARFGATCRFVEGRTMWTGFSENLAYEGDYSGIETRTEPSGRRTERYLYRSLAEMATAATRGWMNSPGHRSNILQRRSRRAGMGVARGSDHRVYFTQVFC